MYGCLFRDCELTHAQQEDEFDQVWSATVDGEKPQGQKMQRKRLAPSKKQQCLEEKPVPTLDSVEAGQDASVEGHDTGEAKGAWCL